MTAADLKGILLTELANLQSQRKQRRDRVVLLEHDLMHARRAADTLEGAVQATEQALAEVQKLIGSGSRPHGGTPAAVPPTPGD